MARKREEKTLEQLAQEDGVDLTLLYERLSWTPTERLVRNYKAAAGFEELRKAGQRYRATDRR